MRSIKEEQSQPVADEYGIGCTGDCVTGDEIAFFNAGKSAERLYGTIVADSYGSAKQQHTFTIELTNGDKMLIKGRNLYKNGCVRKAWPNEADRAEILHEKHIRGNEARAAATIRKLKKERERMHDLPGWAQDELTNDTE